MTKDNRPIEGVNFLEGKLLIALPGMSDPRFEKSVIFMCAHSTDGAMGIMINRAVEGLKFRELMDKLAKFEALDRPVDHDPHSAVRGMRAHEDHALFEARVGHAGERDQKL